MRQKNFKSILKSMEVLNESASGQLQGGFASVTIMSRVWAADILNGQCPPPKTNNCAATNCRCGN